MDCAYVCRVLDLVEAEEEQERVQHRLDQFVLFRTASIVGRARESRPYTKEQDEARKKAEKGSPEPVSPQQWREAEEAERFWLKTRRDEALASQSPWHFEEVMGYAGHVFEKPPEPEVESAEDIKRRARDLDRDASLGFMAAMEGLAKG